MESSPQRPYRSERKPKSRRPKNKNKHKSAPAQRGQNRDNNKKRKGDGGGEPMAKRLRSASTTTNPHERVFGNKPKVDVQFSGEKKELKVRDLQDLICWALADGITPVSWVNCQGKHLIPKVAVIMLDSLSNKVYRQLTKKGKLRHMEKIFELDGKRKEIATRAAGGKTRVFHGLNIILNRPVSKGKGSGQHIPDPDLPGPASYILNEYQLLENGYPVPGQQECANYFRFSKKETNKTGEEHILAVDCEMCQTTVGLELTRISVIDRDEKVLYDKFVKPKNTIINYLTRWSGITVDTLEKVTTTLEDVQKELDEFITSDTILIGHSLENDLHAIKVIHEKVVDTSVVYPSSVEGRKNALKFLSDRFLQQTIQTGTHDSAQDAVAALRLALLKFKNGPTFGASDTESIFKVLSDFTHKSVLIDTAGICKQYSKGALHSVIPIYTDEELTEKTITSADVKFIFSHFHGFEKYWAEAQDEEKGAVSEYNVTNNWIVATESLAEVEKVEHQSEEAKPRPEITSTTTVTFTTETTTTTTTDPRAGSDSKLVPKMDLDAIADAADKLVSQTFEALPNRSLLLIFTGNGDLHEVKRLQQLKIEKQNTGKWRTSEEHNFLQAIEKSRKGLAWITIKDQVEEVEEMKEEKEAK